MHHAPTLIFDLDGTLSDPAVGIARCINHALTGLGHAPIAEQTVSRYIGPLLDDSFAAITGSDNPGHLAALVARYRERYAALGYAENLLYPGIVPLLAQLAQQGVRMGVCTSKRVDFAEQILLMFGLRAHFSFVDGGEMGRHKHQQLRDLLAAGTITQDAIMIGDREVDVSAARANGLRVAAVRWGHGSLQELQDAQPDWLLSRPEEVLKLAHPACSGQD